MRWFEVVNTQASRLSTLEKVLGTVFLRQILLAEARHNVGPTPKESFRGIVAGRVERGGASFLLVEPEGLNAEASDVIPSILVPCTRQLGEGSVIEVEGVMEDPDLYDASEGVVVREATVRSIVAVER